MDTAQVLPGEPKDQIMDRSPDETDVHRTPFEYLPRGQGDRARGVNMSTSRTDDQSQPIDHPTRKEGDQPMTNFTATLELGRLPAKIWTSIQLMKDYEHKLKNIKLEDKSNGHCLHISGDKGTVDRVSTEIQNQLEQIEKDRVDLSSVMKPEQMSMLRVSGVLDYVKDHIKRKGISCHLEQDKDTTRVYATQDYMSDILNEIQVAIFCQEFEIDSTWRLFVYSPYVQQEMCNLQKKHHDKVAITVTESLVNIVCTSDISEHVLESMTKMKADFLEVKTKSLRYTPEGNLTIELCAKVLHDQFNSAREKYGVEISPIRNHDKQGWIVKGPAGTLEEACEDVKKRTAKVVSESVHLKDKVCKEFFESKPGQDVMLRVGGDTGTLVTIDKKEVSVAKEKPSRSDITGTTTHRVASLTSRQWRLGDGSHVALYCGDSRTSPDNILVELKTGDPTSGVKLPPHDDKQYVVTLTIPKWREGVNKEKHTIQTMFKEIITAAAERKVNSLTILLDSCRNSGWDGKKACKLLVKNTLYVLKHDNAVACSCSYFTGDQEKFKLIRNIIDESFNDDKSVTIKDKGKEIDDYEVIDGSEAERKPHLVKGELAKMTSEVIVNTTRTDLRLDQGAVSLSILKAAGREIQQCCNQYYGGVKHGEIAVTHGYKLKCTYVFHGALPHYSTERMNRMEVMEQFMRNCLKEADKRNCKTISFPALGTGNLGYPKDLVAHTMFDTVKKYFQENPDSCVEGVNFVVYPKDRDTIKAFEDEDRKPKGTDVAGATGGVDGQRDDTNNRYTGQPTAIAEETHLVVVSQTGDNMDKAIRQLQNKITELQRQPPDRPPPPSSTQTPPPCRRKEQSGPKSPSPTVDTKDDASVVLTRTEYEKRRLIVTSNSQSALDKKRIEDWLENTTGILIHTTGHNIPMIKVVYPFREDTEALIIFESVKDAEKLMKQQGNDKYLPTKFPKQTVQNVKAKLKSEIVRAIHTQVNRNDIVSVIYDASGATWLDDRGTSYLTGSLPEIQCAYRYIVRIITNVNRDDMFNDGRRQDDSGDFHDDARGYHRPTSQDNNTQSRRPNGDGNDQGENRNAATGVTKQVISHLDAEQEQNNSSSYPDTVNQTNPGQRQSTVTEFSKNAPKSKLKGQTNPNVEAPVGTQNPSAQQEELRSKVETNSINNWNSGELKKTFFNEKQGNVPFRDTRRLKIDNKGPLDTEDSVPEVDNIDFDNISEKGVRSIPRNDGRPDHIRKGSDEADRIRSVTCSSDQFYEVVFFNPEIDKEMDTKCNDSRTEFYVSNPSQRFMKAINKLNNYARREISNLTDIEDNKFKVYHQQEKDNMDILCVYNPSIKQIKIVGEKFDVVEQTERLILQNIGRPYQHSNHHTAGKRKRIKSPSDTKVFLTKGEVQVLMYQGDLLNLDVDVIVHGTNVSLDNPKGQSAGIAEAAGSEFEAACDNIYHTRTLNVTDCCYTTAGNLPYDCIIHAVVPMWNAYKKTSKIPREMRSIFQDDLCKTIMNALEEAVNVGAMSVGLPVFGTFQRGQTDLVWEICVDVIGKFAAKQSPKSAMKTIYIVGGSYDVQLLLQMFESKMSHFETSL
ncbi:uncharacterized protein [Argopecten irradians]|uniref:uncharacterized protein isoform X2 n=1 Tax=Argopecten irradians TaxID=31199 RepID=UPI00372313A8